MKGEGSDNKLDVSQARSKISTGAVPSWAKIGAIDKAYKGGAVSPVTDLLVSRQLHAESRETFYHRARRLDSMQGVQHESQWRLVFDYSTQDVVIHWIRIHRGNEVIDRTKIEDVRVLQREAALEGFVVDGFFTLLLLLEDVRVGDIIESCFTIKESPRLFRGNCSQIFEVLPGVAVARFYFAVRFKKSRPMRWKSSVANLKPDETGEGEEMTWCWSGTHVPAREQEAGTPVWHLASPQFQISDYSDWNTVAVELESAWKCDVDESQLQAVVSGFRESNPETLALVNRIIQYVQDEHRYLSVNLDFGGQIPASPTDVIRRRYGDCKDLSFLLVRLLKLAGVEARPVLVHSLLQGCVNSFLPMPNVFNHAIVEFTVGERKGYVDSTIRMQGGNAMSRVLPEFGCGLPVEKNVAGLIELPSARRSVGCCEVVETLLLDTSGAQSLLGVVLRLSGGYADVARNQFSDAGSDKVADERLTLFTQRYGRAKRVGPLEFRDDREENEFVFAEQFEVSGFWQTHQDTQTCTFRMPPSFALEPLRTSDSSHRSSPMALPYPCQIKHTMEIEMPPLKPAARPRASFGSPYFLFNQREKCRPGFWSSEWHLEVLSDAIPARDFDEHREVVERVFASFPWNLVLPQGVHRVRGKVGFGSLPPLVERRKMPSPESKSETALNRPSGDQASLPARRPSQPLSQPASPTKRRRKRRSGRNRLSNVIIGVAILLLLIVIALSVASLKSKGISP